MHTQRPASVLRWHHSWQLRHAQRAAHIDNHQPRPQPALLDRPHSAIEDAEEEAQKDDTSNEEQAPSGAAGEEAGEACGDAGEEAGQAAGDAMPPDERQRPAGDDSPQYDDTLDAPP